jgi:hypothetical protein
LLLLIQRIRGIITLRSENYEPNPKNAPKVDLKNTGDEEKVDDE